MTKAYKVESETNLITVFSENEFSRIIRSLYGESLKHIDDEEYFMLGVCVGLWIDGAGEGWIKLPVKCDGSIVSL